MIDLHIHTNLSDGRLPIEEVLKIAQKTSLTTISITDHDTVAGYDILKSPEVRKLYSGKILTGIEISAIANGVLVHILGYGFDVDKMKQLLDGRIPELLPLVADAMKQRFAEFGIDTDFVTTHIVDLANDIWDKTELLPFAVEKTKGILWDHIANPASPLYLDLSEHFLTAVNAIDIIHAAGGLAVLAHPAQYYTYGMEIAETLKTHIDGIEVFHYSAKPDYREQLIKFANTNNLFITGGTDFHRPTQKLNREAIPDTYLKPFAKYRFF
ncbi:MAG: PHP domain-containing protein [Firmicutes bacterium]|nr:PHP domain-containing protein [Bacillota bacterium]